MADRDPLHKYLRLRVTAHACHEQAQRAIHAVLRGSPLESSRLHFNAYICESPAIRGQEAEPRLLAPFIDGEVARRPISLHLPEGATECQRVEFLRTMENALDSHVSGRPLALPLAYTDTHPARTFLFWRELSRLGKVSGGLLASQLFQQWRESPTNTDEPPLTIRPFTAADCVADMRHKLANPLLDPVDKLSYLSIVGLLYYDLLTSSNPHDCLFFIGVPLCTQRTFYGLLIASLESPNGVQLPTLQVERALRALRVKLKQEADDTYLPTLVLSQNSWEEHVLNDYLKDGGVYTVDRSADEAAYLRAVRAAMDAFQDEYGDRTYSRLARCPALCDTPHSSLVNDLLEQVLVKLWSNRLCMDDEALSALSRSLVFRKMMVASPGMIGAIRHVASLEIARPSEPPLPAVLIVAPPGSGKEMMSDLVYLFSDFFWNKPVAKLNMGSLNAPPLTPALLMGLEGTGGWFKGVFQKLAEGVLAKGGTLVLDELNSLEIGAQPLLLRLLEQGDLSPLDNTALSQDRALPWLVIGLINEEPDQLTLETLRSKVQREPLFGQLLGSALYEHWKGKSRLRDDLYYRIRRSGEIRITGLNERRQDVPIVFYFRLRQFLRETVPGVEVFLTHDAMVRLTDRALNWRGNMRKLEALARQVKAIVVRSTLETTAVLAVDWYAIEEALETVGMVGTPEASDGRRQMDE